jgi:ArsR family transcriptional regulator
MPTTLTKPTLASRLNADIVNQCADMLKAIGHPIRMSIIDMLENGVELSVTEIYETLEIEQAVASHHLSILREKELILARRDGKNTYYSLAKPQVSKIIACIESCHKL